MDTTHEWTSDDRAAARAFLQRCEVRLSTLHRVATALLSGAGLMVLLPALVKDQITEVIRSLATATESGTQVLLTAAAVLVLGLPFAVLFFVLSDLTRFYFHAQHLPSSGGDAFAPRFTLTGLRLPADELSAGATRNLDAARRAPSTTELLVPANPATRAAIDGKLSAYGLDGPAPGTDDARADGLFSLVASRSRTLAEEVAKVEFGMARHLLRLQVIVMRYVKALLVVLATAIAVYATLAVIRADPDVSNRSELALIAIFAWWAPAIVYVVSSPVRWVESLLRAEGATVASVAADKEFSHLERLTVGVAATGFALSAASLVALVIGGDASRSGEVGVGLAVALAAVALAMAVGRSLAVGRRGVFNRS